MKRAVLLFVKYPAPGKVKTRIAAELGAEKAVGIYRELVAEVCRRVPVDADLLVAFDPVEKRTEIDEWVRPLCRDRVDFFAQADGDLGVRLHHAFDEAFSRGFEQVAVVGSDCIELTAESFREAWTALETHDAAVGPASDGGYYLMALKQTHPELFQNIAWSSEKTLPQTLEHAAAANLTVYLLPKLTDVDTVEDWKNARTYLDSISARKR